MTEEINDQPKTGPNEKEGPVSPQVKSVTRIAGPIAIPSAAKLKLKESVSSAITEVLGAPIQPGDVQTFRRMLMQRFERKEEEGRVEYEWKREALAVDTVLGPLKLTGSQARLYQRTQPCLKEIQVILDRMTPLRSDADMDLIKAQKAVVLDLVKNIVAESGREPPRNILVEKLSISLLGSYVIDNIDDPEAKDFVSSQLVEMEKALFYEGEEITDITDLEDEELLTDDLMLRDNIWTLYEAWGHYMGEDIEELHKAWKRYVEEEPNKLTLGENLRVLSRQLAASYESTQEARDGLTSVGFGPGEQKTWQEFNGDQEGINGLTLDDLLSMVEMFATVKAPKLIQDGKMSGIRAMLPLAEELHKLAVKINGFEEYPFDQESVKHAFDELTKHLREVYEITHIIVKGKAPPEPTGETGKVKQKRAGQAK